MSDRNGSGQLCLQCGLCCDGTLFGRVPLAVGETVPLPLQSRPGGGHFFVQPCAALEQTCCRIYEHRPLACRRFECTLLHAVRDAETSVDQALEVVAQARRLKAQGGGALADFLAFHFGHRG